MKFTVLDLEKQPIEFAETLAPGTIDFPEDIRQTGVLCTVGRADLLREHREAGELVEDIRVRASLETKLEVPCARCLEPVTETVDTQFDLLYRPRDADSADADRAISTSETEIGYYEGDGLWLEDVLREQVLLALPARILCREDCQGLCPKCGRNRNSGQCACNTTSNDPRWSALEGIRDRIKP